MSRVGAQSGFAGDDEFSSSTGRGVHQRLRDVARVQRLNDEVVVLHLEQLRSRRGRSSVFGVAMAPLSSAVFGSRRTEVGAGARVCDIGDAVPIVVASSTLLACSTTRRWPSPCRCN